MSHVLQQLQLYASGVDYSWLAHFVSLLVLPFADEDFAIILGGYSGHGVALSVYLGRWAAEALLGRRELPDWGFTKADKSAAAIRW